MVKIIMYYIVCDVIICVMEFPSVNPQQRRL